MSSAAGELPGAKRSAAIKSRIWPWTGQRSAEPISGESVGNQESPRGNRSKWFGGRIIYAPFGRFRGDQPGGKESDGVLVGRESQRAHLISALLDNTHRGAYLVTGHRGSGKSTLVKHCLEEYRDAAFERYLNRGVGRTALWDRLGLLIFAAAVLYVLLILHDALQVLSARNIEPATEPFLILLMITIFGILSLPILVAWNTFELVLEWKFGRAVAKSWSAFQLPVVLSLPLLAYWSHTAGQNAWPRVSDVLAVLASGELHKYLLITISGLPLWALVFDRRRRWRTWGVLGLSGLIMLGASLSELTGLECSLFSLQLLLAGVGLRKSDSGSGTDGKKDISSWQHTFICFLAPVLCFLLLIFLRLYRGHLGDWYFWSLQAVAIGTTISLLFRGNPIPELQRQMPLFLLSLKAAVLFLLGSFLLAAAFFVKNYEGVVGEAAGAVGRSATVTQFPTLDNGLKAWLGLWGFGEFHAVDGEATAPRKVNRLRWFVVYLVMFSVIFFLEFEWIARSRAGFRRDRSLKDSIDWNLGSIGNPESWHVVRAIENRLFSQTFFRQIIERWNPLLIVPVNLGFDALDHRRVIEAMLTCLREEYVRAFISWRSPIEALKKLVVIALAGYLTFGTSFHVFYVNDDSIELLSLNSYCAGLEGKDGSSAAEGRSISSPPGMILACKVGKEPLAKILQTSLLYRTPPSRRSVEIHRDDSEKLQRLEIPSDSILAATIQELGQSSPEESQRLTPRIYHLLSFIIVLYGLNYVVRRHWPYYRVDERLSHLISSLSGKTREDRAAAQSIWSRLAGVVVGRDRDRYVEVEPLDPRAVEVSTLELLKKMQEFRLIVPYSTRHYLSFPAPEIIFNLDELDKLGVGVIPDHETSGPEVEPTQGLNLERRRSKALHNLFAELKNLLASGVARFVFIGGRNLHDEWLADLSARRPLLANIFEVEIHLTSLLTEESQSVDGFSPDANVAWVLHHIHNESIRNQHLADRSREPYAHEPATSEFHSSYSQSRRDQCLTSPDPSGFANPSLLEESLAIIGPRKFGHFGACQKKTIIADFVEFLSYRSRGNPRRLLALVESFLSATVDLKRQIEYAGSKPQLEYCDHVLVLRDFDLYRIQLIAEVYRRFRDAVGRRFEFDDDKLIVGALYVSDFLLKFHRRAFGWSNLQRVDELVHIHRAPDLPIVFSNILDSWSGRYLHPIRNGMYDYRFASEFSRELRYLSRHSEEELAAVNFTLDESQALKSIYQARFRQLQDNQAYEFIGALGELHEFDEEYEIARFYYRKAISYIDARLKGEISLHESDSLLYLVLTQEKDGLEVVRRRVNWALSRLRLNLQVGMTYERAEDFEQAQAHYRNARSFAAAVLRALLNARRWRGEVEVPQSPDRGKPDFISTVKHFNILFQPAFAEAWICEKLRGGVDSSMRIVERSIWEVRWLLPAVREEFDGENPAIAAGGLRSFRRQQLNFFLIMAEQHNKAGDLLFYKACPTIKPRKWDAPPRQTAEVGGFLGRAHYHYAVCIQEIRSFVAHRRERNQRLQFPDWELPPGNDLTNIDLRWPDFVVDSLSDSLADLADTLISRVSLRDLLHPKGHSFKKAAASSRPSLGGALAAKEKLIERLHESFRNWMESLAYGVPEFREHHEWPCLLTASGRSSATCTLYDLFGWRTAAFAREEKKKAGKGKVSRSQAKVLEEEFLAQSEDDRGQRYRQLAEGDVQALVGLRLELTSRCLLGNYISLMFLASKILEDGGHFEEAARKASRVVEIVQQYLLMARAVSGLEATRPDQVSGRASGASPTWSSHFEGSTVDMILLDELVLLGAVAARRTCTLFKQARSRFVDFRRTGDRQLRPLAAGRAIPTTDCMHICTLALHACALSRRKKSLDLQEALEALRQVVMGDILDGCESKPADAPPSRAVFGSALETLLYNNAYPILGRLNGLKALVDDCVLNEWETGWRGSVDLESLFSELTATAEAFDSPLHFTAFHLGTTQALHALRNGYLQGNQNPYESEEVAEAVETLRTSGAMFSMQGSFYRTIDNLHYLYDDFNDRRVHLAHGLQMFGAELTMLLMEALELIPTERDRQPDSLRKLRQKCRSLRHRPRLRRSRVWKL